MGGLTRVTDSRYGTKGKAPGNAVIVKTATAIAERESELYHPPGVVSNPPVGDRVIELPVGTGRVIIASHNYRIEISPDAGETIIYSTNSDGTAKQAEIKLGSDGMISISNTAADLTKVLNDLIAELKVFKTFGSSTSHTTDPGTVVNLTNIETNLAQIMQEAP